MAERSEHEEHNNDAMSEGDCVNEEVNNEEVGDLGSEDPFHIYRVEDLGSIMFDLLNPYEVWQYNFSNLDIAYEFFNEYAKARGFSLRKSKVSYSKEGDILWKRFVCSREGFREEKFINNPSRRRCGCEAEFRVHIVAGSSRWYVSVLNDVHNHELLIDKFVGRLQSHRRMTDAAVAEMNRMRNVGIDTPTFFSSFAQQSGGYGNIGFSKKQMYNELEKQWQKQNGDANVAIKYIGEMFDIDPKLYWKHEADDEGKLRHLFWCDGESVVDYGIFGEVLAFNATYGRNKYKCPVVFFSGVNHHRSTVVFACAVVWNETENTYVWMLDQFLLAMDGKPPKVVITDGANAIRNAIARVFPKAHHRLCGWHLLHNAKSKVNNLNFKQAFTKCMFNNYEVDEFEEKWKEALIANNLENNDWIQKLYAKKKMWAAAYMSGMFFAGLRTTSRCEGLHTQMSMYVGGRDNLYEFVHHFQRCLDYTRNNEVEADYEGLKGVPVMTSCVPSLEMCAAKIYIIATFLLFRKKLTYLACVNVVGLQKTASSVIYIVQKYTNEDVMFEWHVSHYVNDMEWRCSCLAMESYGIPCIHILAVIVHLLIHELPNSLVCKRWCKNAKEGLEVRDNLGFTSNSSHRITRFATLQHLFRRLCSLACQSHGDFNEVWEKVNAEIQNLIASAPSIGPSTSTVGVCLEYNVGDHVRVRGKECGSSSQGRERNVKKKQRCTKCHNTGHNRRKCPDPRGKQPMGSTFTSEGEARESEDEEEDVEEVEDGEQEEGEEEVGQD